MLCAFNGAKPGEPAVIDIVTEDELKARIGREIDDAEGFCLHNGKPVSARLKRLMTSSRFILLDTDSPEGMPAKWARMPLAERLVAMEPVLPGVSKCARVEYRGSSARVVNSSGDLSPAATHAIIQVSDASKIDLLREHIRIEAVRAGLSFKSPRYSKTDRSKIVAYEHRTLIDLAVLSTGRLVFNAKPDVSEAPNHTVIDASVRVVNSDGGALDLSGLKLPDVAALADYRQITGANVSFSTEGGGLHAHDRSLLRNETEIESGGMSSHSANGSPGCGQRGDPQTLRSAVPRSQPRKPPSSRSSATVKATFSSTTSALAPPTISYPSPPLKATNSASGRQTTTSMLARRGEGVEAKRRRRGQTHHQKRHSAEARSPRRGKAQRRYPRADEAGEKGSRQAVDIRRRARLRRNAGAGERGGSRPGAR